ncbi:MAG TPA: histidine phosphatase family protein [Desulfobacteraceae bacterium]|nr:histidine phosphatase family protein [Desulfobacteraceae bacterium]
MNTATTTHFGIIRHAPTVWNEEKRIQGQHDNPLSARGRTMAREWGEQLSELPWNRLLCSDLARGKQTAELVNMALHLPTAKDPRLREQNWGAWTGMTLREVNEENNDLLRKQEQRGWNFQPPGGESRREVLARSLAALADARAPGESILVICHQGVIKCLLYHLLGRLFLPEEPKVIAPFHLHLLAMEDDTLSLARMNCLGLNVNPTGVPDK